MPSKNAARPAAMEVAAPPSMLVPALAIFGTAFAIRIVHVLQVRSTPYFSVLLGDARGYDEWAQRIAGGDWWGHDVFYQAPLYPYFLGVIYSVAGRHLLLVRLVQAAIGSASCVLVALAASRLISRRAGIAAGAMLALYAPAIFFDGLLQKSVLDVFFVSLALWLIAKVRLKPDAPDEKNEADTTRRNVLRSLRVLRGTSPWFPLGLAVGALSLTRENALVFTIVIAVWALMQSWRYAALFVAGVAVVLFPVAVRNNLVGGGFYVTTAQFGPNFYIGNNPKADGTYASLRYGRGAPEFERQDATELAEMALARKLTPGEVSAYWTDRALQFVSSQPGAWLKLMARKAALLVNSGEMVDTEDQATYADSSWPLWLLGPVTHFGVLVPLAVLGMFAAWPMRFRLWVLYALLVSYAASVVLFYVFARYRYPLVPMLMVFASAAVADLLGTAQPSAFAGATADRRSAKRGGWSTSSGRAGSAWALGATATALVASNWPLLSTNHMRAVTENNVATALQADRRYEDAETHYRRSIAFRAEYAPAHSNLGTVLRARGDLSAAIAAYEEALRLQPDYPDAQYNLANALMDAGRPAEAIRHFEAALRSAPGSAEVHNNLGIALAATGKPQQALAEFETAVRMDPSSAKANRNVGDALLAAGRGAEAIEHFRRATELAPEEGSFHYDYGSVLLEAGRPQDAVTEFRAALRTMPHAPEVHNNLGIALGSLGRLDEAVVEFQEALRANPDFADARRNLRMAAEARARKGS